MSVSETVVLLSRNREEEIRAWRRAIHRRPGLGMNVEETASLVAAALESMGLDVRTGIGGTGVVALLGSSGPTVALRADMDALSMREETGLPFASEIEGRMHACGHDAHTAMLLGAAAVLSEGWEGRGRIKFVFQPAEECAPTGGAPAMIADGVLEDVGAMAALHVWPGLETGRVGVREGAIMAASDRLDLVVRGRSAHGSMPEEGVDAIVIAAQVVSALQSVVSRSVSASDAAVFSLGTVRGGCRYNVIADEVRLEGTLRSLDARVRAFLPEKIGAVARGVATAMGGDCEVLYERGYPPTVNDGAVVALFRRVAADLLGPAALEEIARPTLGGEDFSFFAEKVPSVFFWLGCRPASADGATFPPLHNACFAPDEAAFPLGTALLAGTALKLLDRLNEEGSL